MALEPGRTLRHYRLVEKLGEGGMGQVWLARDVRLDRDVAVKVLPPGFAASDAARARFEREGRTISSLNHPNICTLYDVGEEHDTHFLVLERIEGETLAERLRRGPLPVDQVLELGSQIASALAAAHRLGIVHRDLKPGNVMLTRTGAKLLDFGLAKLTAEPAAPVQVLAEQPTQAAPLTQEGMILGTFQYMAPEQLEGLEADARTDIFALGTLLYEMATARPAFAGKSKTSLIAAIVSSQPTPIGDVQPMTPPALEHVVRRCLEKDPDDRWQSAGDVAAQLRWMATQTSQSGARPAVAVPHRGRNWLPWALVGALGVASIAVALAAWLGRDSGSRPAVQASIEAPDGTALVPFDMLGLDLSPDGRHLAFVGIDADGSQHVWIRDLESNRARRVEETTGASYPFWSPDGSQLGFFADGKLKTVNLRGGSPRVLADAPSGRGGTWNRDGRILFAPMTRSPILGVSSNGGTVSPATPFDPERETTNRWPRFLPDGRQFLYISRAVVEGRGEIGRLVLASLDAPETRVLIEGSTNAVWVAPGYLILSRGSNLMAARFDPGKPEAVGDPVPLTAEKVSYWEAKNFTPFSATNDGTIVFLPEAIRQSTLRWYDRGGRPLDPVGKPGYHYDVSISPDGSRLGWVQGPPQSAKQDVWVREIGGGREYRVTFESGDYAQPRFSPDGSRLAFVCQPKRVQDICVKSVEGGGATELFLETPNWSGLGDWLPDGQSLIVTDQHPETKQDVLLWDPRAGELRPLLRTPFADDEPALSPDGRFYAYVSDESGRLEVYLRELAESSQQWRLSLDGGTHPRWRRDGREVLYVAPDGNLMAVTVESRPVFRAGTPQVLFALPAMPDAQNPIFEDVTADGQRVILSVPVEGRAGSTFHAIFNWTALLPD